MTNIIAFPFDRVKGPRITMTCEIYLFPQPHNIFNPFAWWRLAVRVS